MQHHVFIFHGPSHHMSIGPYPSFYTPLLFVRISFVYAPLHGCIDVVDVLEQLDRVLWRGMPHVQDAESGSLEWTNRYSVGRQFVKNASESFTALAI